MTEPPDLSEELRRMADERIARLRNKRRVRAAMKAARDVGLQRRHAAKMARIRAQKGKDT
jgi:hypothetical protein